MARKRKTRGFGKSNSLMSLLKPALYGAGASYLAARVGVSVPNWAAGAAGGYLAKNNLNSAAVGAIGAIGAPMVLEKINANTGASSNNSGFIG